MILGTFAGGQPPRTNYNQTDPTKADYLLGRENIAAHLESKNNPHGVTAEQAGDIHDLATEEEPGHMVAFEPAAERRKRNATSGGFGTAHTFRTGRKYGETVNKVSKAQAILLAKFGHLAAGEVFRAKSISKTGR